MSKDWGLKFRFLVSFCMFVGYCEDIDFGVIFFYLILMLLRRDGCYIIWYKVVILGI